MSKNYTDTKDSATELIAKFGKTISKVTITQSGSAFDPTPTESEPIPFTGVMLNLKINEYDGTLILKTDKKLLTTTEILQSDIIIDNGVRYSVVDVEKVEPATVTVLYKIILRS